MGLSGTVKVGGTTVGVVGGAVAVGYGVQSSRGTHGALLTRDGTHSWDWGRASARYFVNLIENPDLENKLDGVAVPKELGSTQVTEFKNACLSLSEKVNATQEEKLKRDSWCREFESVFDHWKKTEEQKEYNLLPNSIWVSRYDSFVENEGVKKFLESRRPSGTYASVDQKKFSEAVFWCELLSGKEYSKEAYEDFKSKCPVS